MRHRKSKKTYLIPIALASLLTCGSNAFGYGSLGTNVNTLCSPQQPYTGSCNLCHTGSYSASTPAKTAYLAGGNTLTDFFCPTAVCTDNDGDGYALEGGDCGPVDCDDTNASINPSAAENCTDGIDNNCNGLVDTMDPAAVGCLVCTDNDGDGYAVEGGECGPVDCDDTDPAINPVAIDIPNNGIDENCDGGDSVDPTIFDNDGDGYTIADGDCNDNDPAINPGAIDIAGNGIDENCDGFDSTDPGTVDNDGDGYSPAQGDCDDTNAEINPAAPELCNDGIDNDCNDLVDSLDPYAIDCPQTCFDNDGDSYSIEGGTCGPVDCNDNDSTINPGTTETCDDFIDNDCDGMVDEGCATTCADNDGDGYLDAACGGPDCNDYDAAINPSASEVCGNGIDENCNGSTDDSCITCPDGTMFEVKKVEYKKGKLSAKGRAKVGTTVSIYDNDSGEIVADDIQVKRKGKWKAKIKGLQSAPQIIKVELSNGCNKIFQVKPDHNKNKAKYTEINENDTSNKDHSQDDDRDDNKGDGHHDDNHDKDDHGDDHDNHHDDD